MSAIAAIPALALGVPAAGEIVRGDPVIVHSHSIRLADVAPATSGIAGSHIIAHVPAGRETIVLSRTAIAALVRRALPTLVMTGSRRGTVTFLVRRNAERLPPVALCRALAVSVAAGSLIDDGMVHRTTCHGSPAAPVAFDPGASLPRAGSNLAAGSYLGKLSLRPPRGLQKGEAARLVSTVGPIRIVRDVTAIQSSRGRRIFVRDGDGQIFSVRQAELAR